MKICDFIVPELKLFREQCNFTDLERKCFDMKAKDYSNIQLAMQLNVSESTITGDKKGEAHSGNQGAPL